MDAKENIGTIKKRLSLLFLMIIIIVNYKYLADTF